MKPRRASTPLSVPGESDMERGRRPVLHGRKTPLAREIPDAGVAAVREY